MKRKATIFLIALFTVIIVHGQDNVLGVWKNNQQKYMVKISKVGNSLNGRIVWLQKEHDANGDPVLDINNPDEKMRRLPLKGNKVLSGFSYNSQTGQWENGTYYDFSQGKYYDCKIKSSNGNIELLYGENDQNYNNKITLTKAK